MKTYKNNQKGFIALMATLILMAVITITLFSSNVSSFFARFDSLGNEFKRTSLGLSESCTNVALLKIAQDYNYAGNETIQIGDNTCTIKTVVYEQIDDISMDVKKLAKIKTSAQYPATNGSWSHNQISAVVKNPTYYIPPAPTCSFVAGPSPINAGQSVTLGWNVYGDANHFIVIREMNNIETTIYEDTTSPIEASDDISTVKDFPTDSATYTATISGPGGESQCDYPVSVIVNPSLICAETVMMLDRTGSMSGSDLDDEETAANGLLDLYDDLIPLPKTSVGVFGEPGANDPYNAIILQSLTTVYSSLYNAVSTGLANSAGYTNLQSAINKSQKEIEDHSSNDKEHVIILLSDGGANRPNSTAVNSGPNNGSSFSGNMPDVGTIDWLNASNAKTSDNSYATVTLGSNQTSHYLKINGFNFNIPAGATINGITVKVERKASTSNRISDNSVKLFKNGSVVGNNKAISGTWGTSETTITYGSTNDLWGSTFSSSEINSSDFGIVFSVKRSNGSSTTIASVDNINISVNYTIDAYQLALQAADDAKEAGTKIFTIHFGDAGTDGPDPGTTGDDQDFLATIANGNVPNAPHENGSFNDPGGIINTDTGYLATTISVTPNEWTAPNNAFASDNVYTTDIVNGSNGRQQGYSNFNLNVPPTATINGVTVEVEAKSTDSNGCQIGAELSSNTGTTYTTTGNKITITSSNDATYLLGSSSNLWNRTWTPADFNNVNFIVKLKNIDPGNSCTNGSKLSVDRVRVRVSYTVVPENTDGDNFFIAPQSSDMPAIFETIGKIVCPALTPPAPPGPPPSPPPAPPQDPEISINAWEEIINVDP